MLSFFFADLNFYSNRTALFGNLNGEKKNTQWNTLYITFPQYLIVFYSFAALVDERGRRGER